MSRHRSFALLILTIVFSGNLIAQITPKITTLSSPSTVRTLIHSWGGGDIRLDRPTVLFATSIHQCAGCCATSINVLSKAIRSFGLDANTLVVVAADMKGEGLVLRDQFVADVIAEDLEGKLASVFKADQHFPDMYLISPSGDVLKRVQDIQHSNAISYDDFIAAGLRPLPTTAAVVNSMSVALREPKGKLLVDIETPVLDARGVISFIEPHYNLLYQYDARTGKAVRAIDPDSLKFRFRNPDDNSLVWGVADTAYAGPMVPLHAVLPSMSGDTLFALAEFFTGYSIDTIGERTRFMLKKNKALLSISEGIIHSVRLLPPMPYVLVEQPILLDGTVIVSRCLLGDYLEGKPVPSDSMYGFVALEKDAMTYRLAANLGRIERGYGRSFTPMFVGALAAMGDTGFVFISEGNRMLFSVAMRAPEGYGSMQGSGALLQLLSSPQSFDSSAHDKAGAPDVSASVTVLDIASDSASFHVLLEDKRIKARRERMVLQRYSFDGDLLAEHRVRSRDDEIVAAHIAGIHHGELAALVKWKKARWTIERIPADR